MLQQISIRKTISKFTVLVLCLAVVGIWVYYRGPAVILFLAGALLLWALSYRLVWGWYILVALSPFIQWEIYLSSYRYWLTEYPVLTRLHAPVVEFWAIALLIAWVLNFARRIFLGERVWLRFPFWKYFALFLASALISVINIAPWYQISAVKYILHFILLFYFGYLFLSANIIRGREVWEKSLKVFFGVGLLSALLGFTSLIMGVWQSGGFRRAVPFALLGWAPLGDQHIFLAEVLTVALPIGVYFWYCHSDRVRRMADERMNPLANGKGSCDSAVGLAQDDARTEQRADNWRKFWFWSSLFVLIIGLLTLSRAGWITYLVEGVVLWVLLRREIKWKSALKKFWWLGIIFVPIIFYLLYFLSTNSTVSSSNSARTEITRIAWFYWLRHPVIGNGVGSFVTNVGENYAFILDFGDPTDALGIIQKLGFEQGILGLLAFGLFVGAMLFRVLRGGRKGVMPTDPPMRRGVEPACPVGRESLSPEYLLALFLILSPVIFQLFNTQFYSSKMWVPIALGIAVIYVFKKVDYGEKN